MNALLIPFALLFRVPIIGATFLLFAGRLSSVPTLRPLGDLHMETGLRLGFKALLIHKRLHSFKIFFTLLKSKAISVLIVQLRV